uniref:Pentatricopeptide repeat-containing protein 2, mitochondrial n=1 Tax=Cacopsylla melanoneura TaxID=428564 RepID=A0A8D8ZLA4_9HEMI
MFLKALLATPAVVGQCGGRSAMIMQQFITQNSPKCVLGSGVRFLYSSEALGIDNYANAREKTALQFQDLREKFYQKMVEFSDPASHNMVFTEDLKHILHLAENNETDLKLVRQMLTKFNSQNKELRFGNYIFGPVVMRLYHHLNQPDEALELFLHEDFKFFFTQNNSYHLLLDLLFKNEKYEDVLKVFDIIETRQSQGSRYPRSAIILYLAALYKLNTPEAFERAVSLYKKLNAAGVGHIRRAVSLAAGLAANQGRYNEVIEFLALLPGQGTYVTVRNLKLLAMNGVGRHDDVLTLLQGFLVVDMPEIKLKNVKQTVFKDVMDRIVSDFESLDNVELKANFSKLHAQLKEFNHVSSSTLGELLLSEIKEVKPREEGTFTRSRYNADASRDPRGRSYNDRRPTPQLKRPGLNDLS